MNLATLCLTALIAVPGCLSCAAQSPAPLASVRTWSDLRAQPPVNLPAPPANAAASSYRLGINLAAAKLYGGVVVYCLAKGAEPGAGPGELGFFRVEVQPPKRASRSQNESFAYVASGKQASGETLFMESVPLTEPGDYIFTVQRTMSDYKDASWETVASATVTVANVPGPLWSPWPLNAADGAVGILVSDGTRQQHSAAGGVANPSTGVAIPRMAKPFICNSSDPPRTDQLLPELLPAEPDPGLKLQATGSLLIVTLDHGVVGAYPDEKFLTRWWVNGQPFIPKLAPMAVSNDYFMRHNGMQSADLATQVTFQVEFHPEYLGAKKGDQIGVQLLLCPQGTEDCGPGRDRDMFNADGWMPADPDIRSVEPRLFNFVTFTYTGDPIRMAPLAR